MAHQWRGVLREYADRLDVTDASTVVTLGEGGTPLVPAPALSRRTGAAVWVKYEGMDPTGSFKDRGMTVASAIRIGNPASWRPALDARERTDGSTVQPAVVDAATGEVASLLNLSRTAALA